MEGETLKAVEYYYGEEVTMQENGEEPRCGKAFCMVHEQNNLAKVKDLQNNHFESSY